MGGYHKIDRIDSVIWSHRAMHVWCSGRSWRQACSACAVDRFAFKDVLMYERLPLSGRVRFSSNAMTVKYEVEQVVTGLGLVEGSSQQCSGSISLSTGSKSALKLIKVKPIFIL